MGRDKPQLTLDGLDASALAATWRRRSREELLWAVGRLGELHRSGALGGERMPEDAHPPIPVDGADLFHYFTLAMALNYQRDSYALWRAATATYADEETRAVFRPQAVVKLPLPELGGLLGRYRVALQRERHPLIWQRVCAGICAHFDGDIRNLFRDTHADVRAILKTIRVTHKADFPYLSGPKIANYWLYVMGQYTSTRLKHKEALSVAPDTHVIQASIRLGLVEPAVQSAAGVADIVGRAWSELLSGTDIAPIDVHTPLWLWSRGGFRSLD